MKRAFVTVFLAALACTALNRCGDSPTRTSTLPTASTPATSFSAGTTFTVVSGETGQPVSGARFVVGGEDLWTNGEGEVTLTRNVEYGSRVDILAEGFLDRQTTFSIDSTQCTVWPRTSPTGLTQHTTAELVYTSSSYEREPILGETRLRRWHRSLADVQVILGEGFSPAAPIYVDTQVRAVAELNGFVPEGISYSTPRFGELPSSGYVELTIRPDYSSCVEYNAGAVATLQEEGEFWSARITYCSQSGARDILLALHELGHTVGLRHSSSAEDMMWPRRIRARTFQPREALLMRLMYQRTGFNRFPDNDVEAGSRALRIPRIVDFVCW